MFNRSMPLIKRMRTGINVATKSTQFVRVQANYPCAASPLSPLSSLSSLSPLSALSRRAGSSGGMCYDDSSKELDNWTEEIHDIETKVKSGETTAQREKVLKFYNDMNIDYEQIVVKKWGYISNELAVNLLCNYVNFNDIINKNNNIRILDAGCGTGLVGKYIDYKLSKLNLSDFAIIKGFDIAPKMAETASKKMRLNDPNTPIYCETPFVQCLDTTPYNNCNFNENEFDIVISAGVLPYCKNYYNIMGEWIKLVKKNGIILTSLRTDMTDAAVKEFTKYEDMGILKRIELTEPVVHIGNNETYGNDLKAQFYVARKE